MDIKVYSFKAIFKAHAKNTNSNHEHCTVEEAVAWFQGTEMEDWPSREGINPKLCLPDLLTIKSPPSLYKPNMPPPKPAPKKGKGRGRGRGLAASQPAMFMSMSLRFLGDECL
jgi:hypothetical protein